MASLISTTGFDAAFPIAGQDNDSQGFRTNFNVTKVALDQAKSEITSLQSNTAKLNANNDFNANNITDANFIANTEEVNNIGNIAASQNINWTDGNYQTLTVAANPITLSLTGWGATGKLCKIRLQIATNNVSNVINWNAVGGTVLKGPGFPASFTVSATSNKYAIVDFWTSNAGTTVFADYVGEYSS